MAEENKPMVGAQLPDHLFQLLTLHSIAKNTSKSQIVRDSLLLWQEENSADIDELIKQLRLEEQANWRRVAGSQSTISKQEWVEIHRKAYEKLNVSSEIIDQIFKNLQYETNQ